MTFAGLTVAIATTASSGKPRPVGPAVRRTMTARYPWLRLARAGPAVGEGQLFVESGGAPVGLLGDFNGRFYDALRLSVDGQLPLGAGRSYATA